MQHHIVELRAMWWPQTQQSQQSNTDLLEGTTTVRHAYQRRPAQTLVQLLSQEDCQLTNQVDASEAGNNRADEQREIVRGCEDSTNPVRGDFSRGLNSCYCSSTLLGLFCLQHACVHVFVVPSSLDLAFFLDLLFLNGLLDAHLSTSLVRRQPKLKKLSLILVLLRLLTQVGLFLRAQKFKISSLLLRSLVRHTLMVLLRAVIITFSLLLIFQEDSLLLFLRPHLLDTTFDELNLHLRLGFPPLLHKVSTSLTIHSFTEICDELCNYCILLDRLVIQAVDTS
mmetsp:Transcript_96194/g.170778  ORF Transcript_96194/g.170778 Transcript_96194/m.170778 type:complete len:282 (+) Transcript_96194:1034-1879(+)